MKSSDLLIRKKFAIDFGTANCVIIEHKKGIVLQEPTVVAISVKEKKVIAIGQDAKEMLGKSPQGIDSRRPLKNGGISNYRLSEALLKKFFSKINKGIVIFKPDVIVCAPAGLSSVEERALIQAVSSVGTRKIFILPEPVAAAIGAKMPLHTASGNLIVNLGGGTAEVAILSLNGVVAYESFKGAGDAINDSIIDYLKTKHSIIIGENESEFLKINYASAIKKNSKTIELQGKQAKSGLPISIELDTSELTIAIRNNLENIANVIKLILSKVPPELVRDVMNNGMVLTGGTSLLDGIDEFLAKSVGIPAFVAEGPITCVVRGLEIALGNLGEYRRSVKVG